MSAVLDVIGVGIGPFNLSLAAMLDGEKDVKAAFFDRKPVFSWHSGMLLDEATLQVPFLADLVTLADPTNKWSFLNYLRLHGRQYHFYFLEKFHMPRREYDHYCRWAADGIESCHFSTSVDEIRHDGETFVVSITSPDGPQTLRAHNVVLGVGTEPILPAVARAATGATVLHSSDFLHQRTAWESADSIAVIGGGQSGAEIFLELLRAQPEHGYRLDWYTRTAGFFPMEYSKLGLEHFTPDYLDYFYELPQVTKDALIPKQDLLYKGISAETIADIFDLLYERTVGGEPVPAQLHPMSEVRDITDGTLTTWQWQQERETTQTIDCAIFATGYAASKSVCLDGLESLIDWDENGRYQIARDYRIQLQDNIQGELFIQNGELHTHGVGTPDLGLAAYRSSIIADQICGREPQKPERSAFTHFGATR